MINPLTVGIVLIFASGQATLTGGEVTPILAGQPAPNAGLLVPELRFRGYLNQGIELEACELRLKTRDELLAANQGWWARNKGATSFFVGLAVGITTSVLAILGAKELAKVGAP